MQLLRGQSVQGFNNCLVGQLQRFRNGFPLIISVAMEEEAMALPQPKVLNFTSVMMPSSTLIYMRMMSPASCVAHFAHTAGVFHLAHVPRILEMIHDFFTIQHL